MKKIGQLVRAYRRRNGLTQAAFAAQIAERCKDRGRSFNQDWVSKLETGKLRRQSDAVIEALAEVLTIDIQLLRDAGEARQDVPIDNPIVTSFFQNANITGIIARESDVARSIVHGMQAIVLLECPDEGQSIVLLATPGQDEAILRFQTLFQQLVDLIRSSY